HFTACSHRSRGRDEQALASLGAAYAVADSRRGQRHRGALPASFPQVSSNSLLHARLERIGRLSETLLARCPAGSPPAAKDGYYNMKGLGTFSYPASVPSEEVSMLRSLSKLQATILGVVRLAGLAFAGIGIFAVGDQQLLWSDKLQVTTGFRQIRGLEVGTPVRVQGIKAGQVVAVEAPAEPGGDVIVHLRLSGRMRNLIRSDAAVQIVSEGMLGGKALEINPGTPSAQPIQEHARLASRPTAELNDMLGQV